jgi:hypothetical protein
MNYVGIDPGMTGAIAVLNPETHDLYITDMPLKADRSVDCDSLAEFLCLSIILPENKAHAIIENVHSMPNQGVASTFKFGRSFGAVEGVCVALQVPVTFVSPQVWKASLGVTSNKDTSRELASRLFAGHKDLFKRKKDDGRAEAALLAYFGTKHFGV